MELKRLNNETVILPMLSLQELKQLHYEEELRYTQLILNASPFSETRQELLHDGYRFVHTVMAEIANKKGVSFSIGASPRIVNLVIRVVKRYQQAHKKETITFFEGGIGTGAIVKAIYELDNIFVKGCDVYLNPSKKLDVPTIVLDQNTIYNSLLQQADDSIDIFYWNDLLEHIAPDEVSEHLALIYKKIKNKGLFITITPNWHLRPWDVTGFVHPRGTEAKGFHFKEYTYQSLTNIKLATGFIKFQSPMFYNPFTNRYLLLSKNIALILHKFKYYLEPLAYLLPYALKRFFILGGAYDILFAEKVE